MGKKRLHRLPIEAVGRKTFGKRFPIGGGGLSQAEQEEQKNGCEPEPAAELPDGSGNLS